MKLWPFQLVNVEGLVGVVIGERKILPQTITKELIAHLRESAEVYLGCPIESAVVTVPAYFNDLQQGLTREACANAGLKSVHFIHEPTAAAYAYGLQSSVEPNKTKICLIFDLGGGTFDVTLFRLNPSKRLEVIATGGDARLGGEDFNDLLTEYCIKEFEKLHGINWAAGKNSDDPRIQLRTAKILRRIRNECEKKKCFLSTTPKVVISLDAVYQDKALAIPMNRNIFEGLIHEHLTRCMSTIDVILRKGGIEKGAVDDVVLIGGSSRIPKVQQMVSEYFGGQNLRRTIHADEAVASGAAVYAYNKFNTDTTDDFVTVINTAGSIEPYASIHNGNAAIVQSKVVKKTTVESEVETQLKELSQIREIINKHGTYFASKAAELFSWLNNLGLLENSLQNRNTSSPLANEMLLKALLDTPLLLELSEILFDKYEYNDGLMLAEKVLERRILAYGTDHLKTLEARYQAARCLDEINALKRCSETQKKVLEIYQNVYEKRRELLSPNHADSLKVEYNIAWILENQEKYTEALVKAKGILEIQKRALGENHVLYIRTQSLIAWCHHKLIQTYAAITSINILYDQKLHLLTSNDRDTQLIIWIIGEIFYDKEEYNKALKMYELLYKIRNSTLNPDHPKTLGALEFIAWCFYHLEEYKTAIEKFKMILEIRRKNLGEENEDVVKTKENLALTFEKQGMYEEAKSLYQQVYEQTTRNLGPDHIDSIEALDKLARNLVKCKDYDGGVEKLKIVLEKRRKILGEEHESTLAAKHNIAWAISEQGLYSQARNLYHEVFEQEKRILGPDHPSTLVTKSTLDSLPSN